MTNKKIYANINVVLNCINIYKRRCTINMLKNERENLELVFPTYEYKEQVEEYLQEFIDNGELELNGSGGLHKIKNFDEWLEKIKNDVNPGKENNRVPSTLYLTVRKSDNKIVGNLQIRHWLNEHLLKHGGHIGDSVRPSERRKGYATEQIRLALEKCKELGIDNVLMDCNKNNIGSAKSIINNGGVFTDEVCIDGEIIQNYWISLKKRIAYTYLRERAKDIDYKIRSVNNSKFVGDVVYYKFDNINGKMIIPDGKVILDEGYKWLEFYDYSSKIKLTAVYTAENENVEWYFDIARRIGKENELPFEDDLYLDVVVSDDGKISLIDEDDLEKAFNRFEVSKSDYDMAYFEARNLMNKLNGNIDKLKDFTDYYFKELS